MKDEEKKIASRKETISQLALLTQTPEQVLAAMQASQAALLAQQNAFFGSQNLAGFGGMGRGNGMGRGAANWNTNSGVWCTFHGSNTHNTAECRAAGTGRNNARAAPYYTGRQPGTGTQDRARGITICYNCGAAGHIANACPRGQVNNNRGAGNQRGRGRGKQNYNGQANTATNATPPDGTQTGAGTAGH